MSRPPSVYIFHGGDEFALSWEVAQLQARLGDEATAELNTTVLEGETFSLAELQNVGATLPFLAARRLIVLVDALRGLRHEKARAEFLQVLDRLPAETALVIRESEFLKENHWLMRWAQQAGDRAYAKAFPRPQGPRMAHWIRERAVEEGGRFTPQAADYLAALVGSDTRLADQEIGKMLAYVAYRRPVDTDDVEHLFAGGEQEEANQVFKMVDALGHRQGRIAFRHLHQLLERREPLSLFGMIVRQFRLLLLAREILDAGGDGHAVATELKIHPFVARKITEQATNFDLPTLEDIYQHLADMDMRMKSGQIAPQVALDTLTAGLTASP